MQNGVHTGKIRVMAKKLTSIMSVYPQTQPHRTEYKSE